MIKPYPRILLAAPKSGSGKTAVTCGLIRALQNRGINCTSFKCGPDYIDPMFHKQVMGVDGGNLDTFFLDKTEVRRQFMKLASGSDLSVIEGVMGYYDGVGGDSAWASSYEVACVTDTPVILVIDCKGASLSVAAIAAGFLNYQKDSRIRGVILNRIAPMLAERLKPHLEKVGLKAYGYLPDCKEAEFAGRHLGLVLPEEIGDFKDQLGRLAAKMEETIDIKGLMKLAFSSSTLLIESGQSGMERSDRKQNPCRVRIGVAKDRAFCFYYQENLELLKDMGAKLIEFSPIHDKRLPENLDGLLLGGGYPELYARELSENKSMMESIRTAIQEGLPLLAECGGFLYLHDRLEGSDGSWYPMAGVIHADAYRKTKLSRFGYIELKPAAGHPLFNTGECIKGHEFHYWESSDPGSVMTAVKPASNRSWHCIHGSETMLAGFPHLYYPSNPEVLRRWVGICRSNQNR